MTEILLNEKVPNFEFASTANSSQQLNDFVGKPIILYFYPKDNTSGCTTQAENFRDHYPNFEYHQVVLLGISRDSLKSHQNFKQKLQLPFELISDSQATLCELFGVIYAKKMYGKPVRGIERSTFLIDKEGFLRQEWRKIKIEGHTQNYYPH